MAEETKEERLKRKVDETEALRQETVEDIVRTQRTYPHEALALAAEVLRWRRESPITQAVSEAVPWPNAPFLQQQLQGALAAEVEAREEARKWKEAFRKLQEVRRMSATPEPLPLRARHDTPWSDEDQAKLREAAQTGTTPRGEYTAALARHRKEWERGREMLKQRVLHEESQKPERICTCPEDSPVHLGHVASCPRKFKD